MRQPLSFGIAPGAVGRRFDRKGPWGHPVLARRVRPLPLGGWVDNERPVGDGPHVDRLLEKTSKEEPAELRTASTSRHIFSTALRWIPPLHYYGMPSIVSTRGLNCSGDPQANFTVRHDEKGKTSGCSARKDGDSSLPCRAPCPDRDAASFFASFGLQQRLLHDVLCWRVARRCFRN